MVSERGSEKLDTSSVKFNGKNYSIWEFQFRYYVAGKGLLAYLNGSTKKHVASSPSSPSSTNDDAADDEVADVTAAAKSAAATESFKKKLETWELNNAKVFSWLINSMEY
ncbi:hypothetical protein LINGRAHAP2_LOCUS3885 [Linum grandiflorum]